MDTPDLEIVAGGGLIHRRWFLAQTAGAAGLALLRAQPVVWLRNRMCRHG